jgi:hypothetical protein
VFRTFVGAGAGADIEGSKLGHPQRVLDLHRSLSLCQVIDFLDIRRWRKSDGTNLYHLFRGYGHMSALTGPGLQTHQVIRLPQVEDVGLIYITNRKLGWLIFTGQRVYLLSTPLLIGSAS